MSWRAPSDHVDHWAALAFQQLIGSPWISIFGPGVDKNESLNCFNICFAQNVETCLGQNLCVSWLILVLYTFKQNNTATIVNTKDWVFKTRLTPRKVFTRRHELIWLLWLFENCNWLLSVTNVLFRTENAIVSGLQWADSPSLVYRRKATILTSHLYSGLWTI